jgi:hypothetical protein
MDFNGMMQAASRLIQAGVAGQGKPPEPVRHVVLLQGPDKGFRAITRSVVVPELERAGAKVSIIGDGDSPVTEKQIKDGMAAIEGPATLLVMAHGMDDKGRYKIELGRKEPTYVEDAIFAHVPDKVKGVCLMGCNAEAALGKGADGKRFIDKLPMGTEVRGFSAADDVSTTFAGPLAFPSNADGTPSVAFLLQDRSYETGPPIGTPFRQRGFSAQKDQYIFLEVGLSFSFTSYRGPQ